ncbi:MAG TPA: ATP-binding protein [Blastocatellia bacterium]|jgi:signal transduction histidine kinase|nr:ATP-binding protein [Blastocatellia bacterium]
MKFGAVENRARLAILVFVLALLLLITMSLALYSQARGQFASSPYIIYIFSYQIVALIFGLGLMFFILRRLLRPYRRIVEAAQGSPVHASSAKSESEFVVETFQALIERLQAKERELAQLHALERKRAERSERFSERLIANIPSGLVTVDSRGLVTSANAHALKILGVAEASLRPPPADRFASDMLSLGIEHSSFFKMSPRLIEMISECLDTAKPFRREEVDIRLPDGRVRRLGLSLTPISDASHSLEGALCLVTDITEVLELRERMKLQENLANLGEMAAGLAHEFKNSLATIHGYVQLLEAQGDGSVDDRRTTLDATLNEVRLLARLVTDFLNFARPQQLTLAQVDMRSLIEACADEVRQQLSDGGIELRVEGDFTELAVDESLLRRVFVNLFRNASEAIDPLSAERLITVSGAVDAGADSRYAHIRVRDTGSGISSEDLHRIFIPFFTTKSRGYGIGLALVQKILVAHGGDVSVEKSDCAGTVFHCRLPLSPPPAAMKSE